MDSVKPLIVCCLLLILLLLPDTSTCKQTTTNKPETHKHTSGASSVSKDEHHYKERTGKTWASSLVNKLKMHLVKLEIDLEEYLGERYLPNLRIVGSVVEHNADDAEIRLAKPLKAFLRISTIHAYLTIHQTALVSVSINFLQSFMKSKKKDFEYTDIEIQFILLYLNYQIRALTYEHKSEYLLEFAHICYEHEHHDDTPKNEMEKFIDFLRVKVKVGLIKMKKTREDLQKFLNKNKNFISEELKQALNLKQKDKQVHELVSKFYIKHGLESLISAYLFMSYDESFKPTKTNRNFSFQKYFESEKIEVIIEDQGNKIEDFDPSIPFDIEKITSGIIDSKKITTKFFLTLADSYIKKEFHNELKDVAFIIEDSDASIIGIIVYGFAEIGKILKNHAIDDYERKRAKLLGKLVKKLADYYLYKMGALSRFIELAKSYINYGNELSERSNFIVPFNNKLFALRAQMLLFTYYPVFMRTGGNTFDNYELDRYDFELREELAIDKQQTLGSPNVIYSQVNALHNSLVTYKKREGVVANIKRHRLTHSFKEFRSLSLKLQEYYAALSNKAIEMIMSNYLEPGFDENDKIYDYIRHKSIRAIISNQSLVSTRCYDGKKIENNVIKWLEMRPKVKS